MKIQVKTYQCKPQEIVAGGLKRTPTPLLMDPQPLREIEGSYGRKKTKAAAVEALAKLGHEVRTANWSADHGEKILLVYLAPGGVAKKAPRSAKGRRPPTAAKPEAKTAAPKPKRKARSRR